MSNLYNAPEADLEINENPGDYPLASQGQRFLTMIIDIVGYIIFSVIVGFIIGLVLVLTDSNELIANINEHLLGFIIISIYYITQEFIFGRTMGKFITKTKVTTLDGKKPSFKVIFIRTLCRFIPFEAFSFFGGNGKPRGWHDRISNSKVVSLK